MLLYVSKESTFKIVISTVYGGSVIFLFLASSLYHAFKKEENEISNWRKLDHVAIFFMIAGTYTPICYVYLTGYWKWSIIILQWTLVFGGIFFKFFYLNAPRYLYTVIYLLMGWVGIVPIKQLLMTMSNNEVLFLFLGGLSFTIGAIFYVIKKPRLKPGFGFHEIFHFFILLGGFFHYLLVYTAITQ
ncbi:MAG: hemolysin [Clostridia bacterium]|nr:hemolysin [Clostridia bacterium]MDK2901794.1 hemolysin [Thermosediminibacterales bacterium]